MNCNLMLLTLISVLFLACAQDAYRNALIPKTKNKVLKNVYGAYVEIQTETESLRGEFISLEKDTLYILSTSQLVYCRSDEINSMELRLADSKADGIAVMGAISLFPPLLGAAVQPDYSGAFLTLSIPIALLNLMAWGGENSRKPHRIRYPDDLKEIYSLIKYARFPYGLPDGMNRQNLESLIR